MDFKKISEEKRDCKDLEDKLTNSKVYAARFLEKQVVVGGAFKDKYFCASTKDEGYLDWIMAQNVLILTHKEDPHAEAVSEVLRDRNVLHLVVATEDLPFRYTLSFATSCPIGIEYFMSDEEKGKVISLDSTWNIWNRRISNPKLSKSIPRDLQDIVDGETKKTWEGLLESHKGKVISKPSAINLGSNK